MIKILAVSAVLVLTAGSAVAGAPSNVGTAVVKTGDINPGRASDVRTLQKRLETAALEVCGAKEASVRAVKWAVARSDCYRETLAQATTSAKTTLAIR
jgi:UrcA family protein